MTQQRQWEIAQAARLARVSVDRRAPTWSGRAFTLIDVLVSMAIIGLLISIMLPSLSSIRESTRKVVCASNVRQNGLAITMFSDDNRQGALPLSRFTQSPRPSPGQLVQPQLMHTVRVNQDMYRAGTSDDPQGWDGLGRLYGRSYLDAAGVYYCPSHHGLNPFTSTRERWTSTTVRQIYSNYQYRGTSPGPRYSTNLNGIELHWALVVDSIATKSDFNHRVGANVLYADMSVQWVVDTAGQVMQTLSDDLNARTNRQSVTTAWEKLDQGYGTASVISTPSQTLNGYVK